MKNKRRIPAIVMTLVMCITFMPTSAFAEVDITPPTISNIELTTSVSQPLRAGDTVTITAEISDVSGIGTPLVRMADPKDAGHVNVSGVKGSGDSWSFTFTIPENPWPGTWKIWDISVTDKSANSNTAYIFTGYTSDYQFEVENEEIGDITPPAITNMQLSTSASQPLHAGDTVTITADITDESDIGTPMVRMADPKDAVNYNATGVKGAGDNWSFTFTIPEDPWPGTWKIWDISVTDKSANSNTAYIFTGYTSAYQFEIENSEIGDITPPAITNMQLSTSASQPLHAGDTVTLTADITDESDIGTPMVRMADTKDAGNYNASGVKGLGDSWSFTFTIPEDPWPGTWKIWDISATDNSTNSNMAYIFTGYTPEYQFEVAATVYEDTIYPVIDSPEVSSFENQPGDTIAVNAVITDNIDIKTARMTLISPSGKEDDGNNMTKSPDSNIWSASKVLPLDAESGVWKYRIDAWDMMENKTTVLMENAFTVDYPFISVDDITIDSNILTVEVGKTALLKAKVTPVDATNKGVTWSSSDKNIATVDGNGMVKGISPGSVAITATAQGGIEKTATYALTIKPVLTTKDQLKLTSANKTYNGKAQSVIVTPKAGVGNVKAIYYTGINGTNYKKNTRPPVNFGKYKITVDVAAGKSFGAANNIELGVFTIAKANLSKIKISIIDTSYQGKQLKPSKFIYHGVSFAVKTNATGIKYGKNKNIGKGTVKLTGKGNFTGTRTVTFKILPKKNKVTKITTGKKQIKVKWSKVSKIQKITRYEVRYRIKGTSKWKTKTFKTSASTGTIKKLTKGKKYQVQIRSYKKVSGTKYISYWSATKVSNKIK